MQIRERAKADGREKEEEASNGTRDNTNHGEKVTQREANGTRREAKRVGTSTRTKVAERMDIICKFGRAAGKITGVIDMKIHGKPRAKARDDGHGLQ